MDYVRIDDVIYVSANAADTELHAYLLARKSPVAVSALLFNHSQDDVHNSARDMLLHAHKTETGAASTAYTLRQLAQDVIAMAQAGGMPDTYWQTDRRIARACEVLGVTPEVAREASAKAFEALDGG